MKAVSRRLGLALLCFSIFSGTIRTGAALAAEPPGEEEAGRPAGLAPLALAQGIDTALENNHSRPASRFAVEIAEAQRFEDAISRA